MVNIVRTNWAFFRLKFVSHVQKESVCNTDIRRGVLAVRLTPSLSPPSSSACGQWEGWQGKGITHVLSGPGLHTCTTPLPCPDDDDGDDDDGDDDDGDDGDDDAEHVL